MYNVHRVCRPNPLVAIIAAQKAQTIHCCIIEMRTNLGTKYFCSGKSALCFHRCWGIDCTSFRMRPGTPRFQISCRILTAFCFCIFSVQYWHPKFKPIKPGFLPTHQRGFMGLKTGGLPRFSGTIPGLYSLASSTNYEPVIILPAGRVLGFTKGIGRLSWFFGTGSMGTFFDPCYTVIRKFGYLEKWYFLWNYKLWTFCRGIWSWQHVIIWAQQGWTLLAW